MNRQSGDMHWTRQHPERVARGTGHPSSRTTEEKRAEICRYYALHRPRQTWLARKFGIGRTTLWRYLKEAGLVNA